MLQVRNLPDEVHAKLKARAAEARMSLSDYVAVQLAKLVEYRSNAEVVAAYRQRHPEIAMTRDDVVDAIRAERDAGS